MNVMAYLIMPFLYSKGIVVIIIIIIIILMIMVKALLQYECQKFN